MERSFWSTIRGKLLSRTLVVTLVPVLVIAGVAIAALRSLSGTADNSLEAARTTLSEDVVGARVADSSQQIARELAIFLNERVADAQDWSTDIGLVTGAHAAAGRAAVRGLADLSIDELELMFEGEPRLADVAVERDLLNSVANTPAFKEIFITDVNGFTVDYSNPTSDFVQSDEGWWTRAMENGIDISEPEFDASAGVFAVDISVRLEDEGVPRGVLKAALDINVVQLIADRFAQGTDSLDVTIVDPAGRFLAETSSGHEPSHIMNAIFLASSPTASTALVREVYQANAAELHADGYSITDEGVGGFAHVGTELQALRGDVAELRAFDWTVVVEQPTDVAFAALAPLEGLANEVSSTSSTLTILLSLVALVGTAAAAFMALVFARRITSPIARLRDAAVRTAEVTLPNVVAQIDELEPDEELPELEKFIANTGDEVEDLAHSFNSMQQTAANLASDQARMRRKNVATTFVNLGRRNQNLLSRQLEHINSMEDTETNADTLQRLFQLDHLATRMRRNAESLLVLAGEDTPRRFRQPVSMHQVLQAAGGEIEDFSRIEITTLDDAAVEGGAASDIAHLLAELLENASSYSPPGAPIQVHGRRRENGYSLSIVDQGIGMEEDDLMAANARLADPAEFDRAPSAYLGHFVVGHLAKRHGIRVQLSDSPYGGLSAQMHLPLETLSTADVDQGLKAPAPKGDIYEEAATELTASEQAQIEAIEMALLADSPDTVCPAHIEVAACPSDFPFQAHAEAVNGTDVTTEQAAQHTEPVNGTDIALEQAPLHAEAVGTDITTEQSPFQTHAEAGNGSDVVHHQTPFQTHAEAAPFPQLAPIPAAATQAFAAPIEMPAASVLDLEAPMPLHAETTPSGFRKRRRGEEGAPLATATSPTTPSISEELRPTATRRDPEEVQASLQRFRLGVEAGRARNAENNNVSANPTSPGDAQ